MSLKEHLYLWCHNAGVYNHGIPGLTEKSNLTPVEAARYMGIDNVLMVSYAGKPVPPFAPIQEQFTHFRRVIWSIIGDCACRYDNAEAYVDEVISLHRRYPNVTGGIMDDFFNPERKFNLKAIARKMHEAQLPLWVVVYENQLSQAAVMEQLELCDVIAFWTWQARNLASMGENLSMLRGRFPSKKLVSGLYMWDFGGEKPLSMHLMRFQCDVALDYLRKGIIDDVILLGSPLVGMNLPTIEYARKLVATASHTR